MSEAIEVPGFSLPDPERVTVTDSGLGHEVLVEGEGRSPRLENSVTVHYTGWLENGELFDSSHERGRTATFPLFRVIRGWQEGLMLMKEGGTSRLSIPAELAYGQTPPPGSGIPPGATLVFHVDLIRVEG